MKIFLLSIFFLTSIVNTAILQDNSQLTATFRGYENNTFLFGVDDSDAFILHSISDEAKKNFDLTQNKFKGQLFQVYFTSTKENEEIKRHITKLKRLQ
ncbi:hypothetical protein [Maribacter sp. 2210JD10-5]|uniref:hypothetical protein n=1 Tax=Maribacter sp. 2210JD10-5 TaxID=3386272 RepID=UPI0039BCDE2B